MLKNFTTILFLLVGTGLFLAWNFPDNKDDWREKITAGLLEKAAAGGQVDLLLTLKTQADLSAAKTLITKAEKGWYVYQQLRETAETSQKEIVKLLERENVDFHAFYIINAIRVKGDLSLLIKLAKRNEVAKILENPQVKMNPLPVDNSGSHRGLEEIEWGIDMINADDVWAMGYTGQGVVVAGADTGYEWFHPAIQSKYRGFDGTNADHDYNWHDAIHEISPLHGDSIPDPSLNPCGLDSPVPCDDHNHGTHTMGTMVGDDGDNQIGVAPNAKWIACRNMERGYGSPATYIECFEWFMAPTDLNNENANPEKAPHVVNNSWSCPEMEGCNMDNWGLMGTVVNNLKASGVVVVVSAGNSGSQGCGSVSTPAAMFENSFTIGSTRSNDTLSGFSSRGPVAVDGSMRMKPDVVAPGSQVRSSIRNGEYATYSGTSMAGPHVAGLVALLISAEPSLAGQVDEIETIIKQTAVPKTSGEECGGVPGTAVPNNSYGYGRVDALAAVQLAIQASNVQTVFGGTSIRAFPNPVLGAVKFELQNLIGEPVLEVFNSTGQLMYQQRFEVSFDYHIHSVPLNDLPVGVYFYKITHEGKTFGGKLLKN